MILLQQIFRDIIIINISGDLSIGNLSELEDLWKKTISLNPSVVAFDCSRINFIDSSAIGTLVKFLNNSSKVNIDLVFIDLSDNIFRVFKTAKLNKIFKISSRSDFEGQYKISQG